jgi:transmembrane 9 superfamily member 2/4
MKQDESCVILCKKNYKKPDMLQFKSMIQQEYRVHWLLDGLPVAVRNDELGFVTRGYPVGFVSKLGSKMNHYLYNHVRIIVRYTEDEASYTGSRIVGFEVVPFSIKVHLKLIKLFSGIDILFVCSVCFISSTSMTSPRPISTSPTRC